MTPVHAAMIESDDTPSVHSSQLCDCWDDAGEGKSSSAAAKKILVVRGMCVRRSVRNNLFLRLYPSGPGRSIAQPRKGERVRKGGRHRHTYSYTVRPVTMVRTTRPCRRASSKGVFLHLDFSSVASS